MMQLLRWALIAACLPEAIEMEELLVKFGEAFSVACHGDRSAQDVYMFWEQQGQSRFEYHNGRVTKNAKDAKFTLEDFRNGNYTLTFPPANFSDAGIYECFLKHADESAVKKASIRVTVSGWKTEMHPSLDGSLRIHLHTNKSVHVVLMQNDTRREVLTMTDGPPIFHAEFRDRSEMGNGDLWIHHLTKADEGKFIVQEPESGKSIHSVTLTIKTVKSPSGGRRPSVNIYILCILPLFISMSAL